MALEENIIQLKHMGKEFKTANGPVKALDDINLESNGEKSSESSVFPERERVHWCAASTCWRFQPPVRYCLREKTWRP